MDLSSHEARFGKHYEEIRKSPHGTRTFFDAAAFSWVDDVEERWREVKDDAVALCSAMTSLPSFQSIQREQSRLTGDDRWKVFPFYAYGEKFDKNCQRFPACDSILQLIPGMTSAMFSILRSGKHIEPHKGPFAGVLRYQLGLVIPGLDGDCGIKVGPDVMHWSEGRSLIFDDTHTHEAWNNSNGDRVLLFVDFERPLPSNLISQNKAIISAVRKSGFVTDSLRQMAAWEEIHGANLDSALK